MQTRIAVFCVGGKLMLDDGLGPAVYEQLQAYSFGDAGTAVADVFDVGCMSLSQVGMVRDYDVLVTVDAVEGTGEAPGTIFRYAPDEVAPKEFGSVSLHELRLSDLFEAALLLGYEAEGVCFGMQVVNASPSQVAIGLTEPVHARLADLVDCVLAELVGRGVEVRVRATGSLVEPGFHHELIEG